MKVFHRTLFYFFLSFVSVQGMHIENMQTAATLKEIIIKDLITNWGIHFDITNPNILIPDELKEEIEESKCGYIQQNCQEIEKNIGKTPTNFQKPPPAQPLNKYLIALWKKKDRVKIDLIIDRYYAPSRPVLCLCAGAGYEASVNILLECGAEVNIRDLLGRTPLVLAAKNGKDAICRILLDHGADATLKDACEKTAFNHACENKHYSIVQLLRIQN